jgi:hypothetical protein
MELVGVGCTGGGGGGGAWVCKLFFFHGRWMEPQGGTLESLWGGNPYSRQGVFFNSGYGNFCKRW